MHLVLADKTTHDAIVWVIAGLVLAGFTGWITVVGRLAIRLTQIIDRYFREDENDPDVFLPGVVKRLVTEVAGLTGAVKDLNASHDRQATDLATVEKRLSSQDRVLADIRRNQK